MAEQRVKLIAFSPRLDKALKKLVSGEGQVQKYQQNSTPREKQALLVSGTTTATGVAAPVSPICAIVTGGNDLVGYSVQLYPNGYDQPGIGVGTAFLLQGNPQLQTIPIGTKIMVYPYGGMLETLG